MSKLLLHCGGEEVEYSEVEVVDTPKPTKTHHPLPHREFIDTVRSHLNQGGFKVREEHHALNKEGARYFGVMTLDSMGAAGDYSWSIALRNAHDKAFSAGIAAGSRVLVCDNLCFSGEVTVMRKHTLNIRQDLNNRITQAVGQLGDMLHLNDRRYDAYKHHNLSDLDVNNLMIRALDAQIIPASRIPKVLHNWRESEHPELAEHRNVWGLFNAFTEDFKSISDPASLLKRGRALHGLMDSSVGFDVKRN